MNQLTGPEPRESRHQRESSLSGLPSSRRLVVVRCERNLGVSAGYNVGFRYSLARGFSYVWLINNDLVVDREALDLAAKTLESDERIRVVGFETLSCGDPKQVRCTGGQFRLSRGKAVSLPERGPGSGHAASSRPVEFVGGCAPLVRREVFDVTGLRDERFFAIHGETDWAARLLKRSEFTSVAHLGARVWRKEGGISDAGSVSPISAYLATRHRLLLVWTHASHLEKVAFVAFYTVSRLPEFLLLILWNRPDLIRAKLEELCDFIGKRFKPLDLETVER